MPVNHAAILPSEMLLFCALAGSQNVECVVESGRRHGYSTEVLARQGWRVLSIDTHPNQEADSRLHYGNLTLLSGDGLTRVPELLTGRRAAVLLDGPKGMVALRLLDSIRDQIVLGAIHDCYQGTDVRRELTQRGAVFSDDPEFLAEFGELDTEMLVHRGYDSHDFLREANVLGILKGGRWD